MENKSCSKCSYPLVPSAFDEIKAAENMKFRAIEEKFNNMQLMIEKLLQPRLKFKTDNNLISWHNHCLCPVY
jgi:hypothetical protein